MKDNIVLNSIGKRISFIRSILQVTRVYLQNEYNIATSSLKVWEYDKIVPSKGSLETLIYAFNNEGVDVSLEWLENGGDKIPTFNPQLNVTNKNLDENKNTDLDLISSDDHRALIEIKKITSLYTDCVYLYLSDDSMSPRYVANSWIIGRKQPLQECLGKDCIVKILNIDNNENLTFRRVVQGKSKNLFTLYVLNPISGIYDPNIINVELEFGAPITWVRNLY